MLQLMLAPFVACMVLVAIHAYLGIHIIARGVIFVDLALAQMAALGAITALLFDILPGTRGAHLFAFGFTTVGAAIFALTRTTGHTRVPQEAIIGIVYVVATAATILVADQAPRGAETIKDTLVGSILWIGWGTIGRLAVAYVLIGAFLYGFRHRFTRISFEHASGQPVTFNVRLWDFLFYLAFGLVITLSVPHAGVLLVFTFLVVPGVIAFCFATRPAGLAVRAWGSAIIASAAGLFLSYRYDLPTGPAIVVTFGAVLVLAALIVWLRGRRFSTDDTTGEAVPH
jgi:zinc/manganese transport system permease protein